MSQAWAYGAVLATPLPAAAARVGIRVAGDVLAGLDLLGPDVAPAPPRGLLAATVVTQLEAYFADPGSGFRLPLAPAPSLFQARVRAALLGLGPGRVATYGELARGLGSGPRAVGGACRRNPLPLVVPCHRVVAVTGVGGYAGDAQGGWLAVKRWLLRHEGAWDGS